MRTRRIQLTSVIRQALLLSGSYSSELHASKTPPARPSPGSWACRKTEMMGFHMPAQPPPHANRSPPNLTPNLAVPGSHPLGMESHHLWPPPVSVSQDLPHKCREAPLLLLRGEELFTTGLPQGLHQAPGNRVCSPSHRSGKSSLHSHSWPACLWF